MLLALSRRFRGRDDGVVVICSFCWWRRSRSRRAKQRVHSEHSNGFSFVCERSWRLRCSSRANERVQVAQMCGRGLSVFGGGKAVAALGFRAGSTRGQSQYWHSRCGAAGAAQAPRAMSWGGWQPGRYIPFSLITPLVIAFATLDDVVRGMVGVVSRSGTGSRGRSGAVRASVDCYHATTMCGWVVEFLGDVRMGSGDRLASVRGETRTGNEGCSRRIFGRL